MKDLELWRLLQQEPDPALVGLLEELAGLPPIERIPYLGLIKPLLKDEQPQLRRAALAALAGASGTLALELLVRSLNDDDPEVVKQALESLAVSVKGQPLRWAHAVFHPRRLVRRLAAERGPHLLNLPLLSDPESADSALRNLPEQVPEDLAAAAVHWFSELGLLPEKLRSLLSERHLLTLVKQERGEEAARFLEWFWDDDTTIWNRLGEWPESERSGLLELLLGLQERPQWPGGACRLLLALNPQLFAEEAVPFEIRLKGMAVFYSRRIGSLPVEELLRNLQCPILKPTNWDLWALGAVLHLTSAPLRLLSAIPEDELLQAIEADAFTVSYLFINGRTEMRAFANDLGNKAGCWSEIVAGLLLGGDYEQAANLFPWLQSRALLQTLFWLLEDPAVRPTDKRCSQIAESLSGWARSLELTSFLVPVLLRQDGRFRLASELFCHLSRVNSVRDWVEHLQTLSPPQLRDLLSAIDNCSAFSYQIEGALAEALESHPEPGPAAWANLRRKLEVPTFQSSRRSGARALTESEHQMIVNCREQELSGALGPALARPTFGLSEALNARAAPTRFHPEVVVALVGCHDPIPAVADLIRVYGGSERYQQEVTRQWEGNPNLPLHGHCWLNCYDRHIDQVESFLLNGKGHLKTLMEQASLLPQPVGGVLFEMVARVFSRWKSRSATRLEEQVTSQELRLLLSQLEGASHRSAAVCLLRLWQAGVLSQELEEARPGVESLLADLPLETRQFLSEYVSSQGLGAATNLRRRSHQVTGEELQKVRCCRDLNRLREFACDPRGEIVAEAGFRLLGFSEAGAAVLLELLLLDPAGAPPHTPLLAEWAGLWPRGESRSALLDALQAGRFSPEVTFVAALSFSENGEPLAELALEAALLPAAHPWFTPDHWRRLLDCGLALERLCLILSESEHPHAYSLAVENSLRECWPEPLARFLEMGTQRRRELRNRAAHFLWEQGDDRGFPLLFQEALQDGAPSIELSRVELCRAVESVMLLGGPANLETRLLSFLLQLSDEVLQECAPLVLRCSRRPATCQALLDRIPHSPERKGRLTRLARSFDWGVGKGRQLTGRVFEIEMLGGQELGFTRLEESKIFINPLPLLREERHGVEVVEGLILHELGHHVYHADRESRAAWEQADKEGIFSLLNLVSDEHLERNLRSLAPGFDRRLKRLASYAFLHLKREVEVMTLLTALQQRSFEVLVKARLKVAHKADSVAFKSSELARAMEQHGVAFARFVSALRLGRGNRYQDPKVAQAMKLFRGDFRNLPLSGQLEIARELQRIFGQQATALQLLSPEELFHPDQAEVLVVGEGMSGEEMRRELERLRGTKKGAEGTLWINKSEEEAFPPITSLVPVPFDGAKNRNYVSLVVRHAHRLRQVFQNLGLSHRIEKQRMRGYRLDRSRVFQAVLRGEVRILQARQRVYVTDLFLGVLIDCSGSMRGNSMHRARLFGTLLAQAARGLPGLDLRVLGFNDSLIFDAGDARRCCAHNLEAEGGNNDAGAMAYLAGLASQSKRSARLLVMISDGLPTECSVKALRALVARLTKEGLNCAQVAVRPLSEICFPNYIELSDRQELALQVHEFGRIVARLTFQTLK
ncbi:MAG: vWA domain-containing protein [Vulcanimicrobiota bacterium]